jgi:hypothetical protein
MHLPYMCLDQDQKLHMTVGSFFTLSLNVDRPSFAGSPVCHMPQRLRGQGAPTGPFARFLYDMTARKIEREVKRNQSTPDHEGEQGTRNVDDEMKRTDCFSAGRGARDRQKSLWLTTHPLFLMLASAGCLLGLVQLSHRHRQWSIFVAFLDWAFSEPHRRYAEINTTSCIPPPQAA